MFEVVAANRQFRDEKKDYIVSVNIRSTIYLDGALTADSGHHSMSYSLEEEETAQQLDLHQHHSTGSDDVQKGDDVDHSNAIEDDIARTSQAFLERNCHCR